MKPQLKINLILFILLILILLFIGTLITIFITINTSLPISANILDEKETGNRMNEDGTILLVNEGSVINIWLMPNLEYIQNDEIRIHFEYLETNWNYTISNIYYDWNLNEPIEYEKGDLNLSNKEYKFFKGRDYQYIKIELEIPINALGNTLKKIEFKYHYFDSLFNEHEVISFIYLASINNAEKYKTSSASQLGAEENIYTSGITIFLLVTTIIFILIITIFLIKIIRKKMELMKELKSSIDLRRIKNCNFQNKLLISFLLIIIIISIILYIFQYLVLKYLCCLTIPLMGILLVFSVLIVAIKKSDRKIRKLSFISIVITILILSSLSYTYIDRHIQYNPYNGFYEYSVLIDIENNDNNQTYVEVNLPLPHDSKIFSKLTFYSSYEGIYNYSYPFKPYVFENENQFLEYFVQDSTYGNVLNIKTNKTLFIKSFYNDLDNRIDPKLQLSTQKENNAYIELNNKSNCNVSIILNFEHEWPIGQFLDFSRKYHYISISREPFTLPDDFPDFSEYNQEDIFLKEDRVLNLGWNEVPITEDQYIVWD